MSRWNMRKCSAAGLDVLSTVFQEELLPIVTPIVQQRLQEEDWRARESAILALGAIAEGCVMGLIPYLPQLVSMLLPRLEDPRPLVRWGLPPHVASCRHPPHPPSPPNPHLPTPFSSHLTMFCRVCYCSFHQPAFDNHCACLFILCFLGVVGSGRGSHVLLGRESCCTPVVCSFCSRCPLQEE